VVKKVEDEDGVIIFDDSVEEKAYTELTSKRFNNFWKD